MCMDIAFCAVYRCYVDEYSSGYLWDSLKIPYFVLKPQEWKLGEFVFVEKALKDIIPFFEIPNFIPRNNSDRRPCLL